MDASKVDDLQKQVDAAVQEARKGAGTGNPRQAVEAAVKNVLTSNGIDAEKFQTALKASLDQARGARGQASSTGQAAQPGQVGRFGQPGRRRDNDGDADDGPGASASNSDRGIDVAG